LPPETLLNSSYGQLIPPVHQAEENGEKTLQKTVAVAPKPIRLSGNYPSGIPSFLESESEESAGGLLGR